MKHPFARQSSWWRWASSGRRARLPPAGRSRRPALARSAAIDRAGARAADGRRTRPVQDARHPQRHPDRRHRRPAGRAGRHRRLRQPHRRRSQRRHAGNPAAGEPAAAERRPRDRRHRHVRDARLRRQPRARGRTAQERGRGVRLQAVDGARRHHRHRRAACRARVRRQREGAERAERDRRAAHRQLPASRRRVGSRRDRHAGAGARVGALGQGQRHRRPQARRAASRHHGRAAGRGEEEPHGLDRAPPADRRRADERAQGRAARAADRHALLRPLRGAAARHRRPAVAGRSDQRQRADALRPGGAAVGQDPSARQPGMDRVPARNI